jgi:hypothetical protein
MPSAAAHYAEPPLRTMLNTAAHYESDADDHQLDPDDHEVDVVDHTLDLDDLASNPGSGALFGDVSGL